MFEDFKESIKKLFAYDEAGIRELNDEELDTQFRFISAQITRMVEEGRKVWDVMVDRGYDLPDDTVLASLMPSQDKDDMDKTVLFGSNNFEGVVSGSGKRGAIVAFIGASPSKLDEARGEPFSGPIRKVIREKYLQELGVSEDDVFFTNLVPIYLEGDSGPREPREEEIEGWSWHVAKELSEVKPMFVVALGKTAAGALEGVDEWVPHPRAVEIMGDTGEVARKLSRLSSDVHKAINSSRSILKSRIVKVDDEQRVVYGVVYEPGVEDADGNWTDEGQIEKAAHKYLERFRRITDNHGNTIDTAVPVESYVAPVDFELGSGPVKKGSWVMATKVYSDEEWDRVKKSDFVGYSLGGNARIDPDRTLS